MLLEELVEGVEEFFLDSLLATEKLDVVDQKDIYAAIPFAKTGQRILLNRGNEFVRELFGREVSNSGVRLVLENVMSHGVHEMGLAQSSLPINEEGVVGSRRCMCYRDCCGVCQLAIGADNEILKRVPTIEIGIDGSFVPLVGARCIPPGIGLLSIGMPRIVANGAFVRGVVY